MIIDTSYSQPILQAITHGVYYLLFCVRETKFANSILYNKFHWQCFAFAKAVQAQAQTKALSKSLQSQCKQNCF